MEPAGDTKGKEIVSEILTASENYRDRLTFIIAGYEGEIQEKLYAFNEGLRSRFTEVKVSCIKYNIKSLMIMMNTI